MKSAKVAVLMPIYKTNESHLRAAIESILRQTFTDFVLLILDDCPQESREHIVKSYNDKRIQYFKNEKNLGISLSRNKLIDLATSEYLAIFDHDDISLPHRLEKEVAYLDEHPQIGVVSSWYTKIPANEPIIYPTNDKEIKQGIVNGACYLLHPAAMLRKSILDKYNIRYEEQYSPAEDYMLWGRLIQVTQFYNIPDFLFKYREHKTNTSLLQQAKMASSSREIRLFLHKTYPALCNNKKIYFPCRILPLIKVKKSDTTIKVYLCGIIPILTIRMK